MLPVIGATLAISLVSGPVAIGVLVIGAIVLAVTIYDGSFDDSVSQVIESQVATRTEEQINSQFMSLSTELGKHLDSAGLLRYAGEGLAEAIAIKTIKQARAIQQA